MKAFYFRHRSKFKCPHEVKKFCQPPNIYRLVADDHFRTSFKVILQAAHDKSEQVQLDFHTFLNEALEMKVEKQDV